MLKLNRWVLSCSAILVITACSKQPEPISFEPEPNETRTYRVESDVLFSMQSGRSTSSERIRSMMLTDYHVGDTLDPLQLSIIPRFMHLDYRQGSFSSSDEPDYGSEAIREVISQGFTLELDAERQVKQFEINYDVEGDDNLRDSRQIDQLLDLFKDEFVRPGISHGLMLEQGSELTVAGNDEMPDITLRVTRITDTQAYVTMQGESDDIRAFGLLVLDKASGWVDRAVVISDIRAVEGNQNASVRAVMTMLSADWSFDINMDHLSDYESGELPAFEGFRRPNSGMDGSKVFPSTDGYIEEFDEFTFLAYEHAGVEVNDVGRIQFNDAKAYTVDGEALDLDLQLGLVGTYEYDNDKSMSMARVLPLGWHAVHEKLEQLAYIEVSAERYAYQDNIVSIAVRDHETEVTYGDARASLAPTDEEGIYALTLLQGERTHFDYSIATEAPVFFSYLAYKDGPEWLEVAEQRVLSIVEHGSYPTYYYVDLRENKPRSIELLALTAEASPSDEPVTLRFYHPDAVQQNPRAAAPQRQSLYASAEEAQMRQYTQLNMDSFEYTPRAPDELAFEPFSQARAFLTLSPEQAGLCELQQSHDDIQLQEVTNPPGLSLSPGRLNDPVILQARTEDTTREYFYSETLEITLECPTQWTWEALTWQPEEQPWLVSLSQLPGVSAEMPVRELLRRFAFLSATPDDSSGETIRALSLGIVPPNPDALPQYRHPYLSAQVADYLYEGEYLRVAGNVATIMQLVAEGDYTTVAISHEFPPLPDLDTTFEAARQAKEAE
ncbi:hypothetical protein [Aliidiomarina maris]|uniref:Lipoprotein n=1 Tax=Aliidiomarina maris TaxID=531312 RepID=A0A327WRZ6_9GAMM|nr:hypothetical protein [Aliidiomarina maris]RAJ94913.1 hypothetical protein B0I24_11367 [Aliidiomarina maris]RUO20486.1 hypothetical protein CWE07_12020 [Aliidiomarina maris]